MWRISPEPQGGPRRPAAKVTLRACQLLSTQNLNRADEEEITAHPLAIAQMIAANLLLKTPLAVQGRPGVERSSPGQSEEREPGGGPGPMVEVNLGFAQWSSVPGGTTGRWRSEGQRLHSQIHCGWKQNHEWAGVQDRWAFPREGTQERSP